MGLYYCKNPGSPWLLLRHSYVVPVRGPACTPSQMAGPLRRVLESALEPARRHGVKFRPALTPPSFRHGGREVGSNARQSVPCRRQTTWSRVTDPFGTQRSVVSPVVRQLDGKHPAAPRAAPACQHLPTYGRLTASWLGPVGVGYDAYSPGGGVRGVLIWQESGVRVPPRPPNRRSERIGLV
jgi:hypothetical protein